MSGGSGKVLCQVDLERLCVRLIRKGSVLGGSGKVLCRVGLGKFCVGWIWKGSVSG